MNEFEIEIVEYFNNVGGKKTDSFLSLVNSIRFLVGFWSIVTLAAIIRHPDITREFIISVLAVSILHFTITEGIMKHFLARLWGFRKRPYTAFPNRIRPIGKRFSDSSFPSSHMATTAAMVTVIYSFYPSLAVPAVALIFLMAFSRLRNGMHYPSDIVVGTTLGAIYGVAALKIVTWI